MTDSDRKFSEEEFALILKTASEIQERPTSAGGGPDGISLDEIRAIAKEVGIDPSAVDRAAAMVPRAEMEGRIAKLMGGPTKYRLEHTADGKISEADLAKLLDAVRRAAGQHGKVEYGPRGFEWNTVEELSVIYAFAVPAEDETYLSVTADRGPAALLTVFLSCMGWMVAAGMTGAVINPESAAVGAAILAGGFTGGVIQARVLWGLTTKSIRKRLHGIMESLTGAAEEAGRARLETPRLPAETSRDE